MKNRTTRTHDTNYGFYDGPFNDGWHHDYESNDPGYESKSRSSENADPLKATIPTPTNPMEGVPEDPAPYENDQPYEAGSIL